MGKETKEKGKHRGKKITQFPTQSDVQEELEDAAMDRFLRQSIIEDADRIERELNEDPKLIGIGASDDLFGKIVEELKTKGSGKAIRKRMLMKGPSLRRKNSRSLRYMTCSRKPTGKRWHLGIRCKRRSRKEKRNERKEIDG